MHNFSSMVLQYYGKSWARYNICTKTADSWIWYFATYPGGDAIIFSSTVLLMFNLKFEVLKIFFFFLLNQTQFETIKNSKLEHTVKLSKQEFVFYLHNESICGQYKDMSAWEYF